MSDSLYIIAAGLGSRMNSNIPKALMKLPDGRPNILNTIDLANKVYKKIYVIGNIIASNDWINFFNEYHKSIGNCVHLILIKSGQGDGDAICKALYETRYDVSKYVTILWGDTYIENENIFKELYNKETETGIFPVCYEKYPYVTIIVDENKNALYADFRKHAEFHDEGYHDQSIFKFNRYLLDMTLFNMKAVLFKNNDYKTEFVFLNILHCLNNKKCSAKIYETQYSVKGFNTIEEFSNIK